MNPREQQFLKDYFDQYRRSIFCTDVTKELIDLKNLIVGVHAMGRKTIIAGNGGSAAIASHCAVDFTKNAGVRCINFNEADLITCFANDYGYEHWLAKALEFYADEKDAVILISSSGQSPNVLYAGKYARDRKLQLITFTGFSESNPLKSMGDINLWVNSGAYNIVETTHQIWLLAVCDLIIGAAEYPAKR